LYFIVPIIGTSPVQDLKSNISYATIPSTYLALHLSLSSLLPSLSIHPLSSSLFSFRFPSSYFMTRPTTKKKKKERERNRDQVVAVALFRVGRPQICHKIVDEFTTTDDRRPMTAHRVSGICRLQTAAGVTLRPGEERGEREVEGRKWRVESRE
jgi:hypothetical protein